MGSEVDLKFNIDFNSTVWVRPEGNVVIDPLPLSDYDEAIEFFSPQADGMALNMDCD